jgi:hypothetical protein
MAALAVIVVAIIGIAGVGVGVLLASPVSPLGLVAGSGGRLTVGAPVWFSGNCVSLSFTVQVSGLAVWMKSPVSVTVFLRESPGNWVQMYPTLSANVLNSAGQPAKSGSYSVSGTVEMPIIPPQMSLIPIDARAIGYGIGGAEFKVWSSSFMAPCYLGQPAAVAAPEVQAVASQSQPIAIQQSFSWTGSGNTITLTDTSIVTGALADVIFWNISDGFAGIGTSVTHTFAGPATYLVTETVVAANATAGENSSISQNITDPVTPGSTNSDVNSGAYSFSALPLALIAGFGALAVLSPVVIRRPDIVLSIVAGAFVVGGALGYIVGGWGVL